MRNIRKIREILKSKPTLEGAGVHLRRAFGYHQAPHLDPFLLLDDFHSNNPDDYIKGFPWHPHRGIETITYMLYGQVDHGDSMGNRGSTFSGDVQWMTAGSGIIHQEMPKGQEDGLMWGFQLWANLPASHKMMPPRYQEVKRGQIPEVRLDNDVLVKVICGEVNGTKGPVENLIIDPEYLDVSVPPATNLTYPTQRGYTVFAYVFEGKGYFESERKNIVDSESLVIYDDGDEIAISTQDEKARFLLISGKPIGEPIAWYGPIVMNTQEELRIALEEYQRGTFLKHGEK
jgi:redox-sensitive bicupin YhaK (pirin superfamily)